MNLLDQVRSELVQTPKVERMRQHGGLKEREGEESEKLEQEKASQVRGGSVLARAIHLCKSHASMLRSAAGQRRLALMVRS